MVTETFLPEIRYIILNHVLEHTLGRGLLEQLHRVGEVVFVTEGTNSGKPVPFTLTGVSKEVVGNIVEDIAGEATNHAKECKLLDVKQSLIGKTASKEEHNWLWCLWMGFKKLLCGFFHVLCYRQISA